MSYILDALNKSEAEKQRKRASPGLDALHRPAPERRRRHWLFFASVVVILVVVNGAFLYWWMAQRREPAIGNEAQSAASPTEAVTAPATSPIATPADTTSAPVDATREPAGELITPQTARRTQQSSSLPEKPTSGAPTMAIGELPSSVQQQLPDLRFSSHIYASAPDLRMVNINGKSLREGELVSDGIRLVEITEEGVVLRYRDYRFEVSVLRDWSAH
ncbi:MAG: general secretion pathway protein GspB [Gammaproteobacteria bacterium]|nr:general secretion pathway protein GspB [Gammaproteobacteria bacterium]